MVLIFIQEKKLSSNFLLDSETSQFVSNVLFDNIIDTYSIDEINTTEDIIKTTDLHPELIDYIFNNMPENYSDIEKAIFVYLKLCRIFVYSPNFYASGQSDEANDKHKDISLIP